MNSCDLFTVIDTRASAIRLDAPAPTQKHLERILSDRRTCARPWTYLAVAFCHSGRRQAQCVGERMAELLKRKAPNTTDAALESERAKRRARRLIVVVAAKVNPAHKVPEIEQVMASRAAVQNMFSRGHRAWDWQRCGRRAIAAYDAAVKQSLGLAPADHIVAFLYLGTATVQGKRVRFRWRVSLAACSQRRNSHAKRCSRTIVGSSFSGQRVRRRWDPFRSKRWCLD